MSRARAFLLKRKEVVRVVIKVIIYHCEIRENKKHGRVVYTNLKEQHEVNRRLYNGTHLTVAYRNLGKNVLQCEETREWFYRRAFVVNLVRALQFEDRVFLPSDVIRKLLVMLF